MAFLDTPDEFSAVFLKRGRSWTVSERDRIIVWLNDPPRLAGLLTYTASHLGYSTTADDAEDAWQEYGLRRFESVIKAFDPDKQPFIPYFLLCLKRHMWKVGKRIRRKKNLQQPLIGKKSDGTLVAADVVDTSPDPEQRLLQHGEESAEATRIGRLHECVAALPQIFQDVAVRHLDGLSRIEIAASLGLTRVNVGVRLHRASRCLSQCMKGHVMDCRERLPRTSAAGGVR